MLCADVARLLLREVDQRDATLMAELTLSTLRPRLPGLPTLIHTCSLYHCSINPAELLPTQSISSISPTSSLASSSSCSLPPADSDPRSSPSSPSPAPPAVNLKNPQWHGLLFQNCLLFTKNTGSHGRSRCRYVLLLDQQLHAEPVSLSDLTPPIPIPPSAELSIHFLKSHRAGWVQEDTVPCGAH